MSDRKPGRLQASIQQASSAVPWWIPRRVAGSVVGPGIHCETEGRCQAIETWPPDAHTQDGGNERNGKPEG